MARKMFRPASPAPSSGDPAGRVRPEFRARAVAADGPRDPPRDPPLGPYLRRYPHCPATARGEFAFVREDPSGPFKARHRGRVVDHHDGVVLTDGSAGKRAAHPRHLGARIGVSLVLPTWGSAITHYPHLHGIVPGRWGAGSRLHRNPEVVIREDGVRLHRRIRFNPREPS